MTNYATPSTTTKGDHDASSDCTITCSAGTQIATQNATSCTTPSGNWYVGENTVKQGETSSVNSCAVATNLFNPSDYDVFWGYFNASKALTSYATNAVTYIPVSANTKYIISGVRSKNGMIVGSTAATPASGVAVSNVAVSEEAGQGLVYTTSSNATHMVIMVMRDGDNATTSTRDAIVAANVAHLQIFKANAGYGIVGNTASDHDAASDCQITCSSGEYLPDANGVCQPVGDGFFRVLHTVAYGSKSSRNACLAQAGVPSNVSGTYTSVAPRGYVANCRFTGNAVTKTGCSSVVANTVAHDGTAWGTNYYTATAATGYTVCSADGANPACCANCNKITLANTTNGGTGGTTALYKLTDSTAWYTASTCSGTAITTLPTKPTKTHATYGGHYTGTAASGGTQYITSGGALSSSWTTKAAATLTAQYDCGTNWRGSGTRIKAAGTGTKYGCTSGQFLDGATCTACTAGYQCPASDVEYVFNDGIQGRTACTPGHYQDETGQTSCKDAAAGYYVPGSAATTQTACTGATYQDETAMSSCKSCPTSINPSADKVTGYDYWTYYGVHDTRSGCHAIFKAETLEDGTASAYCYVDEQTGTDETKGTYGIDGTSVACRVRTEGLKCNGGYYNEQFSSDPSLTSYLYGVTLVNALENACTPVEAGYWSADESLSRTACASGTTIGYGAGADEAGDCGRVMNVGGGKLYLRSERKTAPSFNVTIGSTTYYGNMSTADKKVSDGATKSLKANVRGTTYSVYDDSAKSNSPIRHVAQVCGDENVIYYYSEGGTSVTVECNNAEYVSLFQEECRSMGGYAFGGKLCSMTVTSDDCSIFDATFNGAGCECASDKNFDSSLKKCM